LTRILQKYLESPLSKKLLGGEFKKGDVVIVDVNEEDEEGLSFSHANEG
jgi:ATP-dependent Clp protease ATP-binding subunit ClpA